MSSPSISVVIPTYNRVSTLGRAVQSVLAQTFADLELIVVDDGSTDDTALLLAAFDDPRLRVIRLEESRGAAAARNLGASEAKGKFLAFQDSDDEWLLDKLRLQLDMLNADQEIVMVCCSYFVLPASGLPCLQLASSWMKLGYWSVDKLSQFHFIAPTWLLKRDVFDSVGGFDAELDNLEDWELALRLFNTGRIVVAHQPLVVKHGGNDGLNEVRSYRIQSLQRILDVHQNVLMSAPVLRAEMLSELGRIYCDDRKFVLGREYLVRAFSLNPRKLKYSFRWLITWLGARGYARILHWVRNG